MRRSTLYLVGVFFVLLAATLFIQKRAGQSAEATAFPTATPAALLFSFPAEEVIGLRLESSAGQVMALARDAAGVWSLQEPVEAAALQDAITPVVAQLVGLRVVSAFAQPPALDLIGLDEPAYTLTVLLASGASRQAQIGNVSPTGNGYYVLETGSAPVLVDKYGLDFVLQLLTSPPLAETPTPTGE